MKQHERYIIDEREIELLDKYAGIISQRKDPYRYDTFDKDVLAHFCRMKDTSNDMYYRRYQAAKDVIDMIANEVDIDPDDTAYNLYVPDPDCGSPILNRIKDYISRGGEKALLKKRVQELEKENQILRSVLRREGENA